jgi:hypothetical protein
LWMHMQRAQLPGESSHTSLLLQHFLSSYRKTLGTDFEELFGTRGVIESSIHFGCEIFARTVGWVYFRMVISIAVWFTKIQPSRLRLKQPVITFLNLLQTTPLMLLVGVMKQYDSI